MNTENEPPSGAWHPRLQGINIPLHLACATARVLEHRDRKAVIWLANLAANWRRISLVWRRRGLTPPLDALGALTADALSQRLGIDARMIRAALTDPDEERGRFTVAVEKLRAEFEAAIPALAPTKSGAEIERAWAYTGRQPEIAEVRGLWRHGKTEQTEALWLRHLDTTVWFDCPSDGTEWNFLVELARAVGVGIGGTKKARQLRPAIKLCFGAGMIERIVGDETHNLLPNNPKLRPARLEYLRELNLSTGVALLLLTTEQYELAMSHTRASNTRWAGGQWIGRVIPFQLPETHEDAEIVAIAKLHAPELGRDPVPKLGDAGAALVTVARHDVGYLGTMVRIIHRARDMAGAKLCDQHLFEAIAEHHRGTAAAKAAEARAGVKANVVALNRRAA